jgi:hypothetical protein
LPKYSLFFGCFMVVGVSKIDMAIISRPYSLPPLMNIDKSHLIRSVMAYRNFPDGMYLLLLISLGKDNYRKATYSARHEKPYGNEQPFCCVFSCFSASQNREFASRRSVGRKIAKIWALSECTERQPLSRLSTFQTLPKGLYPVAIAPLSHCDKGSIATPQRLYRNAKEA